MLKLIKNTILILLVLLIFAVASALLYRAIYFTGPVNTPQALPKQKIIDMHVHIAGYHTANSGCHVSEDLQNNFRFHALLNGFNVSQKELETQGDPLVVDRLAKTLYASENVDGAVLLALDGVVDEQGNLDLQKTEFYVPNDYVHKQVSRYADIFHFGASVNPYRNDAIERLENVKKQGAVLIKWIPNIQLIDPSDPKLTAFYKKMKALDLALLTHTGQERAFSKAQDEYGDPLRLELPLSLGVKVIAAHIATTGENEGEENFQRILPLFKKWPNLYSDISSLTQVNKLGYLNKAILDPALQGRLLYGSDFPLSNMAVTSAYYFPLNLTISEMYRIDSIENHWDRDIALKQALGTQQDIFARSAELLNIK